MLYSLENLSFIHTLDNSYPVAFVVAHFHCFTPFQTGIGLQGEPYKNVINSHSIKLKTFKNTHRNPQYAIHLFATMHWTQLHLHRGYVPAKVIRMFVFNRDLGNCAAVQNTEVRKEKIRFTGEMTGVE